MSSYIAWFRGINVGGHNKLPMATLKDIHAALGHRDVITYIQSGNVIFDSDAEPRELPSSIETAVAAEAGLDITVMIRTPDEVARALASSPFASEPDRAKTFIAFLATLPDPTAVAAVDPEMYAPDTFAVEGREVHVRCPSGLGRSKLNNTWLEKQLGVASTIRNHNTIDRVLALAAAR